MDYSQDNFNSYRANSTPQENLDLLWAEFRMVPNYVVSQIQPNKAIVWWCTILVILLFVCSITISCYVTWIIAIVINVVMIVPSAILIWGYTKKQRKDGHDKFKARSNEIDSILKRQNTVWGSHGLNWSLGGKLGGWLELHVKDTFISIGHA